MEDSKKAIIIGAGPVGSYLGARIAKDIDTIIYEEHEIIGKPVQCSGIITSEIKKSMRIKNNIIINKIKFARLHSEDEDIRLPVDDYIVDRVLFDETLSNIALNDGAKIIKSKKINEVDIKNQIKSANNNTLHIIGADGPNSIVSRKIINNKSPKFLTGIQYIVKGNFNKDEYDVFFDKEISKDFFAWIVPENENTAKIGLAGTNIKKENLDNFIKKLKSLGIEINQKTIIEKNGGLIPMYSKKHIIQKKINKSTSVSLVGDAGVFVKATTGGGILPGINSAKILSDAIINDDIYSYSSRNNKKMNELKKNLDTHLFIHNYLKNLKTGELSTLLKSIKNKKSFEESNRDDIKNLLKKTAIKNPKLIFNAIRFYF